MALGNVPPDYREKFPSKGQTDNWLRRNGGYQVMRRGKLAEKRENLSHIKEQIPATKSEIKRRMRGGKE